MQKTVTEKKVNKHWSKQGKGGSSHEAKKTSKKSRSL